MDSNSITRWVATVISMTILTVLAAVREGAAHWSVFLGAATIVLINLICIMRWRKSATARRKGSAPAPADR